MLYLVTENKRNQYGILNTENLSLTWVNKDWVQMNLARINNYVPQYTSEVLNIRVPDVIGFFEYKTLKMLNIHFISDDLCVTTQAQNGKYWFAIWFKGYSHIIKTTIPMQIDYFIVNGKKYQLQFASPSCFLYRRNKNTLVFKLYMSDIVIGSDGAVCIDNKVTLKGTKESLASFKRGQLFK